MDEVKLLLLNVYVSTIKTLECISVLKTGLLKGKPTLVFKSNTLKINKAFISM